MKGSDFLWLAVDAFGGLGLEAVYAFMLEPALYGVPMEKFTPGQTILHWILTCVTWGIIAFVLIRKAERKYQFPILKRGKDMRAWQWCVCLLLLILAFWVDNISWGGFKVYLEFIRRGPLLFVFQYLYYMFETMLFLLIIVFGQRAFELWLGRENIPYGGVICGLTWGAAHVFTKDLLTGLLGIGLGFAMGSVYLLVNRDIKKAYVLLFLLFVL